MKKHLFSVMAALCAYCCAIAQSAVISGKITDAVTHKPLFGVTVFSQVNNKAFITGTTGTYRVEINKAGSLRFSKGGYHTVRRYISASKAVINLQLVPIKPLGKPTARRTLAVGDTITNLPLPQPLAAQPPVLLSDLSALKNKLVILDFWNTWCGACLEALPQLAALQRQFDGRLQVIPVTKQSSVEVAGFLKTHPKLAALRLPFLVGDTLLSNLFPHRMVPHEVWIDGNGIVRAITGSKAVTAAHIRQVLEGDSVQFAAKKDILDFDASLPLLQGGNSGKEDRYLQRCIITGRQAGLPSMAGNSFSADSTSRRLYAVNLTLAQLYRMALNCSLPAKQQWVEPGNPHLPADKTLLANDNWLDAHLFCYDLVAPAALDVHAMLLADLDRFFHLHGRVEKRELNCLALVRTHSTIALTTVGGRPGTNYASGGDSIRWQRNLPLRSLVAYLNAKSSHPLVVDETGWTAKTDLELVRNLDDLPALNLALARYGLQLQPVTRRLDCLVIAADNNNKP